MIPLSDGTRRAGASVCWILILANVLAFLAMRWGTAERFEELTYRFANVPARMAGEDVVWARVQFVRGPELFVPVLRQETQSPDRLTEAIRAHVRDIPTVSPYWPFRVGEVVDQALPPWFTILSSMFMHGGWLHLLSNMLFLFVFGPRVEHHLGRWPFLGFYIVCGVFADLSHVVADFGSRIPVVGASGAIAGLLGAYVRLFPEARVLTLVPLGPFMTLLHLPSLVFVGLWVVTQFFIIADPTNGGVAVWAHLGGFFYGLLLVTVFAGFGGRRPTTAPVRSHPGISRRLEEYDYW